MPTQKYLKKTRDLIGKFDSRIAHLQEEIDICAKYDHDLHRCLQEQKTQNLPLHQQYENLKEFSKSNYNPIAQSASRKLALLCKFRGILEKSTYDIGTAKKGLGSLNAIFSICRFSGGKYHYPKVFEAIGCGLFSKTKKLCSQARELLKERISVEAEAAQSAGKWRTASPVLNALQSFQVTSSAPSPEANVPGQP